MRASTHRRIGQLARTQGQVSGGRCGQARRIVPIEVSPVNIKAPLVIASLLVCGPASANRLYDLRDHPLDTGTAVEPASPAAGNPPPKHAKVVNDAVRASNATLRLKTVERGACAKHARKVRDARETGSSERCD